MVQYGTRAVGSALGYAGLYGQLGVRLPGEPFTSFSAFLAFTRSRVLPSGGRNGGITYRDRALTGRGGCMKPTSTPTPAG